MAIIPQLSMDSSGRVHGANVTWNSPWPCPNGSPGEMSIPHGILGVIMHTMVGNLPGTIGLFNNPGYQASAHFGIDQDGNIHQFGPVNGWKAWHICLGNANWYGIEHADNGNPDNPLTQAQINSSAQLVELLSRIGVFPLQVTDSTGTMGYGTHCMGGEAWGGHTCPNLPPEHVRSAQRAQILSVAQAIRDGQPVYPTLQEGDTGPDVEVLQERLNLWKAASPALEVDGEFGPDTLAAVREFQKTQKLSVDGIVGPDTWAALLKNP